MQTGACDAAITSSTSLISFRLEEVAKSLTTGRGKSYWFMLEPLVMSKQVFDALPKDQQDIIMALGLEARGVRDRRRRWPTTRRWPTSMPPEGRQDCRSRRNDGRQVARDIARDTAWKDYAQKTALSAELLKLAEGVHVS